MIRRPPRSTRTDTLFPYTTLFRSLQQRNEGLQVGQLLLVDENIGVLELDLELLGVGHEIGREIAAIELHALDRFELGREALRLLDCDDALIADLLHGSSENAADFSIARSANRRVGNECVSTCRYRW